MPEAIAAYRKRIELDPEHVQATTNLNIALSQSAPRLHRREIRTF